MRLTASGLQRASACAASYLLPHGVQAASEAQDRGIAEHLRRQKIIEAGGAAARALVFDEPVDVTSLLAEVAFALNVTTGKARELGRGIGRDYAAAGAGDDDMCGTVDVLATSDGHVYVGDWKTGMGRGVARAADNLQLAFGAVCAAEVFGACGATVELIFVDHDPMSRDRAMLDVFTLAARKTEIIALARKIHNWPPERLPVVVEGDHCRWCPAFDACPAKRAALAVVVAQPSAVEFDIVRELSVTPEQAYRRWRSVEEMMERVRAQIHKYVRDVGPIQLGDNKEYGPRKTTRRAIDGTIAFDALAQVYGDHIAKAACPPEASQAGIKRALAAADVASSFDKVMELIDAKGGVSVKEIESIDEHAIKGARSGAPTRAALPSPAPTPAPRPDRS